MAKTVKKVTETINEFLPTYFTQTIEANETVTNIISLSEYRKRLKAVNLEAVKGFRWRFCGLDKRNDACYSNSWYLARFLPDAIPEEKIDYIEGCITYNNKFYIHHAFIYSHLFNTYVETRHNISTAPTTPTYLIHSVVKSEDVESCVSEFMNDFKKSPTSLYEKCGNAYVHHTLEDFM